MLILRSKVTPQHLPGRGRARCPDWPVFPALREAPGFEPWGVRGGDQGGITNTVASARALPPARAVTGAAKRPAACPPPPARPSATVRLTVMPIIVTTFFIADYVISTRATARFTLNPHLQRPNRPQAPHPAGFERRSPRWQGLGCPMPLWRLLGSL